VSRLLASGWGWTNWTGTEGRTIIFQPSASGTGRIGWKFIADPTLASPVLKLPLLKLRSNSVNSAHTSEVGSLSLVATSLRLPCLVPGSTWSWY
jgi:hypothetical protein